MNGYFDSNATTPLHPAAREAWLEASERFWQNPSGLYREAGAAKRELEEAREQMADWLGCGPEEIVFLSGATEANNAVMRHFSRLAAAGAVSGIHPAPADPAVGIGIAVSALEHPSVAEPAEFEFGARLHRIPAREGGTVCPEALRAIAARRPALISLMAANNETGVLQPWREALAVCREFGVAFHCDAAQWIGKMPPLGLGECDFVTGSAHKFGGPKGIGFLKVPSGGRPLRWLRGGPQEERRRAGTENLPAVAAMAAAWKASEQWRQDRHPEQLAAGRDAFEKRLRELLPAARVIPEKSDRLWNTSLITVPPPGNVKWLSRLSALGFQVSTGSACSQGGGASEVLRSMGLPEESLGQVLRLSGGMDTTEADWLALAGALVAVVGSILDKPAVTGALPQG